MKKSINLLLIFLLLLSFLRCNERDEKEFIAGAEHVKIDSVSIVQDTMDIFSIQTIRTYSTFNANCEGFYGYDYRHADDFTRKVISYKFTTRASCEEKKVRTSQINFRPQIPGEYIFKFFGGLTPEGSNIWLEEKIFVK